MNIMESYAKLKWICNEKGWFDGSNEGDLVIPNSQKKIHKFLQFVKIAIDTPEAQRPQFNPYTYANLADWIDCELKTKKFIVLVAYRGNWCIFCKVRIFLEFSRKFIFFV